MSDKELFECLKRLSKTNNLRDGIDIRKEEANIILKEIERLNNITKEVREYILKEDEWVKNSDYRLLKTDRLLEILDKESE